MRISDWSSDVCSSDLHLLVGDEFGDTVADDVGTIIGELVRLAIGEVDQPQVALADKADITALGRHLGVGCKALAVGALAQRRCGRSEERCVGNECESTCRSRGGSYN